MSYRLQLYLLFLEFKQNWIREVTNVRAQTNIMLEEKS